MPRLRLLEIDALRTIAQEGKDFRAAMSIASGNHVHGGHGDPELGWGGTSWMSVSISRSFVSRL